MISLGKLLPPWVLLHLGVAAFRWSELRPKWLSPRFAYNNDHPFVQEPQTASGSVEKVFLTTQAICRNMGAFGTNICWMCSCQDWQSENPSNCAVTLTTETLLSCLKGLSGQAGAAWGFMVVVEKLATRFGCHGYGITDKEVQYLNPLFREKIFSSWFRSPTGIDLRRSHLPVNTGATIQFVWGKQRQICDDATTNDFTVDARIGFRTSPDQTLSRDPHFSCVHESPNYTTTARIYVSDPDNRVTVTADIPEQAFADSGTWLGPDEWFAIDVAIPHPCKASQEEIEPFLSGDVYEANVQVTYPVLWMNPFDYTFWDVCCAMPPAPSQAGAVLDQSANGIFTHQWIKEGGILRGVDPELCDFLGGRVIRGSAECLALSPGVYAALATSEQYDWQ